MSRLTDMEAAFEEWFQARRRDTFGPDRAGNRLSDHPNWSMGLRSWLHEGWMGAVLWCRLCRREHEGACAAPSAEQQPDIDAFLGEGRKPVRSLASVMVPSARDPELQPDSDARASSYIAVERAITASKDPNAKWPDSDARDEVAK